ncbi:MAG: helix-turn-helix domain-containing protein [Chloroflexota bacterium]
MEEKWLTTTEVAERLNATSQAVRDWIRAKQFPNARPKSPVPRSPFEIPESDVLAFEERRRQSIHNQ